MALMCIGVDTNLVIMNTLHHSTPVRDHSNSLSSHFLTFYFLCPQATDDAQLEVGTTISLPQHRYNEPRSGHYLSIRFNAEGGIGFA